MTIPHHIYIFCRRAKFSLLLWAITLLAICLVAGWKQGLVFITHTVLLYALFAEDILVTGAFIGAVAYKADAGIRSKVDRDIKNFPSD